MNCPWPENPGIPCHQSVRQYVDIDLLITKTRPCSNCPCRGENKTQL